MDIIFWLLLTTVAYVYIGYPLFILLLSLFVNREIHKEEIEPNITLLITAYNEEKNILAKLENTLNLDYPKNKLEIIVASDGSTDKTDTLVSTYKDRGVVLFRVEGRVGKTETQNKALTIAQGEIIIFSDATTTYDKLALRKIIRNYVEPSVGAVSGRYQYFDKKNSQIGKGTITFWDYENFIKVKQSKIGTITGCCGCIYSIRKKLYEHLPGDIISDLVEPLKILEKGFRIVFEPDALAYESTTEDSKEEFKMRVRVISRGIRGLMYMKQILNPFRYGFVSFQLISHKILRWTIPLFLLGLFLVNITLLNNSRLYMLFFLFQLLFYTSAIMGWFLEKFKNKSSILSLPLYFCVVNAASMIALLKTLFRKKDITWETVRK